MDGLLRRRLVPHQRRRRFAHEEDCSDGRPEFPARGAHDRGAFLRRGRREAHRDRDAGEVRADPRAGGERRRYNRLRRRERTGPEPACIRGMENRGRDRLVRRVAVRRDEKFGRETVADRRRRGRASAQRDADRLLRDGGRRTAAGDRLGRGQDAFGRDRRRYRLAGPQCRGRIPFGRPEGLCAGFPLLRTVLSVGPQGAVHRREDPLEEQILRGACGVSRCFRRDDARGGFQRLPHRRLAGQRRGDDSRNGKRQSDDVLYPVVRSDVRRLDRGRQGAERSLPGGIPGADGGRMAVAACLRGRQRRQEPGLGRHVQPLVCAQFGRNPHRPVDDVPQGR